MECLGSVVALHNNREVKVAHMLGDIQFNCLEDDLLQEYNIKFNDATANEHVPEVERMIIVVKERI